MLRRRIRVHIVLFVATPTASQATQQNGIRIHAQCTLQTHYIIAFLAGLIRKFSLCICWSQTVVIIAFIGWCRHRWANRRHMNTHISGNCIDNRALLFFLLFRFFFVCSSIKGNGLKMYRYYILHSTYSDLVCNSRTQRCLCALPNAMMYTRNITNSLYIRVYIAYVRTYHCRQPRALVHPTKENIWTKNFGIK